MKAVVLVEANLSPEELKLGGANKSKVSIIFTGSNPLKHPKQMEICKQMITLAKKLHFYKPVLLGLGLNGMLEHITDDQLDCYEHLVTDRDDRAGQILLNYDRIHSALDDAITQYGLVKPPLFAKGFTDRNAITFYSDRQV